MRIVLAVAIFLHFVNLCIHAQETNVKKSEFRSEISKINGTINSLGDSNGQLQRTVSEQKKQIDNLSDQLAESQANIKKLADSTNVTVSEISSENKNTQSRIREIDQTISKRTVYWVIIILLISLLGFVSFVLLRRKQTSSSRDFDSKIEETKLELERLQAGANKHDAELAEVLQTQLGLLKGQRSLVGTTAPEIDHKLPLKVGDEIHRMRKRIENMPQEIKSLGALRNSLTRLEEEFNENGYEIEDLLGKKYVDGMKVEARFVDDPNIPKGEEIITDILRPQIGYRGQVIQVAKVEVGKSY